MAQIKEITTLNTVATVRKAAQESMKPVIDEIETKMKCMSRDMQQLSANTKQILQFQKKLKRVEEENKYLQTQLQQVRDNNQMLQCQMLSDRDRLGLIEQNIREQLRKFQKEKEKQDEVLQTINQRNVRVQKQMVESLRNLKERETQMELKFRNLNQQSQKMSRQVKSNAQLMKNQFQKMQIKLSHQAKESGRRLQLLDMYETERQFINEQLRSMNKKIDTFVSQEQLQTYKANFKKQQSKFSDSIRTFLDENFSQTTRQMISTVPQMKIQLSQCLAFQQRINSAQTQLQALNNIFKDMLDEQLKENEKNKSELSQKFDVIGKQRQKMQEKLVKALSLQGLIQVKINEYSDQLKDELRFQNEQKSRQLFNQIKVMFADTREAMRQKQLQNIVEERKKLFNRCVDMQDLGQRIGEVLTNFSTKITKMRSDNQLFVGKVKKELQRLNELQVEISQNNEKIGLTLAQITQSILAEYCININQSAQFRQQIFYSTKKDGVIFQKFQNTLEKGKLTYRRKQLDSKLLRRAVISSLIDAYDKLMVENNCLGWTKNSPWSYFKKSIEPIYQNINQKKDCINEQQDKTQHMKETVQFSTIPARQTISSTYEKNSRSRNISSSRKSNNGRYTQMQTGQIFAHKSARRVRIHLNSSLGIS